MQPTRAHFFDGQSARRHEVEVALSEDRLAVVITGDTLGAPLRWPLPDLRAPGDSSDSARLTLTRRTGDGDETLRDPARLVLQDPVLIAWMRRTRPQLFRRDVAPGTGRRIAIYAGGALVAAALMLFVILPALAGTLARMLPAEREVAFGKTVTAQIARVLGGDTAGDLRCDAPAGRAALHKLRARLTSARELTYDIELQVFDHGMVNAFAAPGGQVVILRGLLEAAGGPEDVAGVLAHEIGHVEARDPTRHALRAAGSAGILTMLIGDFTGAAALAILGEHMLTAAYSRSAERAADDFALDLLDAARIDATGLAGLFDRMGADGNGTGLPAYLSTHTDTGGRAAEARNFAARQSATAPVLTDAGWQALQDICG